MSDIAIKVENLSKVFHIGVKDSGLLSERISHGIKSLFSRNGKSEDPTEFWALRDINFEIKKGDAVGIIGRNGAGKSTLLKILSRITEPTTGRVTINGRVASLLEVGTGFHPELTGRENIFMNGAILGMKQAEIKRKFDEIVDFSGIEKFIDTPVKHYSSGMYVRLAFAVAAHLEPEILVVDEVLAVGDAEFQKKCLGKMEDVSSKEGRTVLFVSHSMTAISSLCSQAIFLEKGRIEFMGDVSTAVNRYLQKQNLTSASAQIDPNNVKQIHQGSRRIAELISIELCDRDYMPASEIAIGEELRVRIGFRVKQCRNNFEIGFAIVDNLERPLLGFVSTWEGFETKFNEGEHYVECKIPSINLLPNTYSIIVWIKEQGQPVDHEVRGVLDFQVIGKDITGFNPYFERYKHLGVFQRSKWSLLKKEPV